ncbi:hypothetical protein [Streptomyces mobaraensis]|uniref:Uncharacterized protein n=1 Tax=Streptomyces mobaraensis TaxID=35621 RepID=A0A5N5W2W1_STRMB|nr:hypothetical protein [Streptomyces mobaraensis]KAB7835703.1 hypothetical protein FRZ00_26130 [Streptomyces mobaraensis]
MDLCRLGTPADPGFRIDIEGRARFLHEGFTVEVQMRRATPEDVREYYGHEYDPDEVVMEGTVTLCGVDVATVGALANERDADSMREALARILAEVVDGVRRTIARLSVGVQEASRKHRAKQV